jgi:hypothetical protein
MLDAFIIDQLRKERDKTAWAPTPLHAPSPSDYDPHEDGGNPNVEDSPDTGRGVIIIDIAGEDDLAANQEYSPQPLNYEL